MSVLTNLRSLHCRSSPTTFRFLATVQTSNGLERDGNSEWKTVLEFRYIKPLASMNKLKMYQIGATLAAVPGCVLVPEVFDPTVVAVMSFSGMATLCLASLFFKNTVGFVYTSQKRPELVKFAFMDFWGRRKDVEMKINDVVPVSELSKSPLDDYYTNLKFMNGHPGMKLFYKAGGIADHEEFMRVFGSD